MESSDVARILEEIADLLELRGENPFRVRAYRNASNTVRTLPASMAGMPASELMKQPGIGKDLAEKISVILETGTLPLLEELHGQVAPGLRDLFLVPGLGPKRVRALHDELHINSLEDLRLAAERHRIRKLGGFGAKTEQNILAALEDMEHADRLVQTGANPAHGMH